MVEMASVTIRLDDEKRDELEQLARSQGSTVSDMLRFAIDGLLRRDVPRSLDMVARRQLALLHEILVHVDSDPDAGDEHRRAIKALSGGYTSEYYREFYSIDTEFPPGDGPLVMDILDMFDLVEPSLARLDEAALAEVGEGARFVMEFVGFDYQDPREARLARFAEYLIADERWANLAHHFGDKTDEPNCPNSHRKTADLYERMVRAYQEIITARSAVGQVRGASGQGFLDVSELRKVYAATRRPDLPVW